MATTSRLLTLLSLLQARRDWPGSVRASRLEVSDRTVRRDIGRLREMGYRIEATMGPDGGYRLYAGAEMPPLLFDDDQALAVALALRAAPSLGADIGEAAVRALAMMRQVLPSRLRHRLDALEVTTVRGAGDSPAAAVPLDVLLTLAQAVRDRVTVRFDYLPRGEGDPQLRRVEPHHLVTSHGRWYLLGWDLDRDDWRLFAADRVRPRSPHGAPFVPRVVPGGDVDAFVSARFKGSDTNEWPCRGTVLLHAPPVTCCRSRATAPSPPSTTNGALSRSGRGRGVRSPNRSGGSRWRWRSSGRPSWRRRSRCSPRGLRARPSS